ncbi:hypothetical protein TNCV_1222601 [Trichonephila clavipes]|nr:hypothetical protein TNCV_1222601 [Trichonephila clavipes]
MLAVMHLYGRSVSPMGGRNTKVCNPNVEVAVRFIDPPYSLRDAATSQSKQTFSPGGTNGGWDQDRGCRLQTRDPRQSEIIRGVKEAHPGGLSRRLSDSGTRDWEELRTTIRT